MGFPGGSDGKASACSEETQVRSLGWEDPLEKEMATQFSILAWKIPWTEDPGRLQSMGLQRIRHNWATSHKRATVQKFREGSISRSVKWSATLSAADWLNRWQLTIGLCHYYTGRHWQDSFLCIARWIPDRTQNKKDVMLGWWILWGDFRILNLYALNQWDSCIWTMPKDFSLTS